MSRTDSRDQKHLRFATELINYLRPRLNTAVSIRLWDGSMIPLGSNVIPGLEVSIASPGVAGAFLRWTTAETLLRLYATGGIGYLDSGDRRNSAREYFITRAEADACIDAAPDLQ